MSIYFIRDDGYIKIGLSADPWRRLASFQTSHHNELELLAVMPGGADLEAGLHRAFAQYAKRGEWFEESPALLTFIETIKATFPNDQRRPEQETVCEPRGKFQLPIAIESADTNRQGVYRNVQSKEPMNPGDSFTFRMTHKGHFQSPSYDPFQLWDSLSLNGSGYWRRWVNEEWYVMCAPGLRFDFIDMQHVQVSRIGDVLEITPSQYGISPRTALEMGLNTSLRNAVYNRKNCGSWLGIYNDERMGITIAIRKIREGEYVNLDVPEEVIEYWRSYKSKRALSQGVILES